MTLASFRLFGDESLTALAVTTRLALTPSRSHEVGDLVGGPRSPIRCKNSLWLLGSAPDLEDDVELDEQIQRLLDKLLPVAPAVWELVHQGYEANWFCFVSSHATEHAVELDRTLLGRLLELPGDLWIDACGDDVDD